MCIAVLNMGLNKKDISTTQLMATTVKMASSTGFTVVERCSISLPPQSVPATSLPLTLFDIPWLLFSPSQPLFFYDFPISTAHFTHIILPNLKQSLSLTLKHFFPLAGKLVTPPLPAKPHLQYTEDDSVSLTIAVEAAGDFKNLVGNHRKMAGDFHCLVPALINGLGSKQPLLSVQITVFPEVGICIGFALRHVAADGRTFDNFLKTWASVCRNGTVILGDESSVAFHDRSVVRDPNGLASTFLKEWNQVENTHEKVENIEANVESTYDMIRDTFVLGPQEMTKIKKWILTRSNSLFGSTQLLLSPYVVVCAFVWACWMKSTRFMNYEAGDNNVHYFGFIAGGITRLRYVIPTNYVGNCVGFGRASATRNEFLSENGIVYAAKAIGDTIKKLNEDVFDGAENWISEWKVVRESEDHHLMVTGSPKLGLYGLDFGWGRPVKIEEVSIDKTGAISLCEGREAVGDIEIGVALPRPRMDAFSTLFKESLDQYSIVNDLLRKA